MKQNNGYSTTIRGWLEAGGHRLMLAQIGPDHCVVRGSIPMPPTEAKLVIEIDGDERHKPVFLQDGIPDNASLVKFTNR